MPKSAALEAGLTISGIVIILFTVFARFPVIVVFGRSWQFKWASSMLFFVLIFRLPSIVRLETHTLIAIEFNTTSAWILCSVGIRVLCLSTVGQCFVQFSVRVRTNVSIKSFVSNSEGVREPGSQLTRKLQWTLTGHLFLIQGSNSAL